MPESKTTGFKPGLDTGLLSETDQFDARFFDRLRNEETGRRLGRLFIPCTDGNWARLNNYIERKSSDAEISDYWKQRAGEFSYTRRADGVVCITGYFNATFPNDFLAIPKAVPPIQKIMNRDIVAAYFELMERTLASGGMFLCVNRLEKPNKAGKDIMRFADYPWPKKGFETLIDEEDLVSRASRRRFPTMRRLIRKLPG